MAAGRISKGEPNGMTVVELLIATVMIGILSAIAIPGILQSIHRTGRMGPRGD